MVIREEWTGVRTLLVVRVRYQARSEVQTLLVFNTEFNHKRKDSEVVRTLLVVRVRYQARSEVQTLLVFRAFPNRIKKSLNLNLDWY